MPTGLVIGASCALLSSTYMGGTSGLSNTWRGSRCQAKAGEKAQFTGCKRAFRSDWCPRTASAQQWQRRWFFNGLLERVCTSEDWQGQRVSGTARSVSGGGLGSDACIDWMPIARKPSGRPRGRMTCSVVRTGRIIPGCIKNSQARFDILVAADRRRTGWSI